MMKVGCNKIIDKKTGKQRKFSYADIDYETNKWVDASKFLPADFDLVYIKTPKRIKTIPAWSVGSNWDGLNIKIDEKITHWKKRAQYF